MNLFSKKEHPGLKIIKDYGKAAGWDRRAKDLSAHSSNKLCDFVTFSNSLGLSESHSLLCKTDREKKTTIFALPSVENYCEILESDLNYTLQ